jgi:hypothetical protein
VQNGVGVVSGFLLQAFESFRGRENNQLDPSFLGFALHGVHDGKGAGESITDDQLAALPGNLLFNGKRGKALREETYCEISP